MKNAKYSMNLKNFKRFYLRLLAFICGKIYLRILRSSRQKIS